MAMEEPEQLVSSEAIKCDNCENLSSPSQKYCSKCSYPIGGTEEEKKKFKIKIHGHKFLLEEAKKETNTARIIILVLAGIVFLTGLFQGLARDNFAGMILNLCLCLLYLILATWCSKNPFGAILTAFIVYITINVVNAFFDPLTLFQGLIMKIIFIGAFIKGIRSAKDAMEHLSELEKMKAAPVENS